MKYIPQLEESEPGLEEQSIVPGVNAMWDLVALMSPLCTCSKAGGAAEQFSFYLFFFSPFWLRRQDLLQDYLCKQLALCMAINTNLETHGEPRALFMRC